MEPRAKVDVPALFRLWGGPLSNEALATALGVSRGKLASLREKYGLPVRSHIHVQRRGVPTPDPDADEIEQRAAEVRAGWTREQEERRWHGGPRSVYAKRYAFNGRDAAFSSMD